MKTVLLFAHECAPYHRSESTIGAQRPAQFAKYLPKYGWRTIVLCCDVEKRRLIRSVDSFELDEKIKSRLENPKGSSIIIPTPSLQFDGIIDRLWIRFFNQKDQSKFIVILRKILTFFKFTSGDYSQSWQPCAKKAAKAIAHKTKIDIVVAEHGPDASIFLARWFSLTYKVPWIIDFRDPVLLSYSKYGKKIYKIIFKILIKTSKATINVTPVWSYFDRKTFKKPAFTIPNGYDADDFNNHNKTTNKKFRLVYIGSLIYPHQKIDLFLKYLKNIIISEKKLFNHFEFFYRGKHHEIVQELIKENDLYSFSNVNSYVNRKKALDYLQNANVLLLLSAKSHSNNKYYHQGMYPGKVFEYLGARRPIVLFPGDRGILDRLILETNSGRIIQNEVELRQYLTEQLSAWNNNKTVPFEPNIEKINQYSRDNLSLKLSKILEKFTESN